MTIAFLARTPFYNDIKKGKMEGGLYNGYVATDKELPDSCMSSNALYLENPLDNKVHVHGGITYDMYWRESRFPIIPLTAIPEPEVMDSMRVIGFDTLHCDDTKERWDYEAVKAETLDLLRQIEEL